jgi:protocatechuate 3,4-dioxygenase beta subunit
MKLAWIACCFAGTLSAFQAAGGIEGQIFNLQTGAPLKRANVRLTTLGRAGGGRGPGPATLARETDDQGRFAFANLEAGRYQLSAERQGFLRQNYGGRKYNTSGTPIVLGADQRLKDIVLKMNPQSVIAGKVLDEDGEPVANVQVRAFKQGYRSGKKQWVQAGNGNTSDIGEFRIPGLEPGRFLVATNQSLRTLNMMPTPGAAPLPDAPDLRYAATYYPSTMEESTAVPVDVAPGAESRGIDIRLVKTQVFRVRGRVAVAAGGRPPMVMLMSKDGTRQVPNMTPARPPDFRFEIAGVAPGSYIVYAQGGDRTQQSVAFQPVEVQNRHVDGIVLSPAPGADVTGTIKVEDTNDPLDLTRINVMLRPANNAQFSAPPRGRVAAGAFVLKGVAPLRYAVNVTGIPEGTFVKSTLYGGREVPDDGVDFTGGTLEITLSATAGSITAAALDKDGKPMPSAMVAIYANGAAIRGYTTDETGVATFNGLKPGDYTVIAWEDIPPGAYLDPEYVKQYSGTAVKLEPRGKAVVQVKAATAP